MLEQVEKYGVFELKLNIQTESALVLSGIVFEKAEKQIKMAAFRNHKGEYLVRFMPDEEGIWNYHISIGEYRQDGCFECVGNTGKNHGRVVVKKFQFQYEDGERFIPFGTTCYAWIHQSIKLQEQTLETLAKSPFNKIRMTIFPKSMPYNHNDPDCYPFLRKADGAWDFSDPDPLFWEKLDRRIEALCKLGIEADLILFHPYDRWGFASMTRQESLAYLEYCIARLAAYRNIWWSLANEYETMYSRSMEDWEVYGTMLKERDCFGHLRSVHNILDPFPRRDWLTHCSIQSSAINRIPFWKEEYGLPVVIDECGYEGNLPYSWGNLSAFEMVHRFWWCVCRGGFCTHGETFHRDDEVLWWAKGGKLYGESWRRIDFLKKTLYGLKSLWQETVYTGKNPNLDETDKKAVREEALFQEKLSNAAPDTRRTFIAAITPLRLKGHGYVLEYFGHCCPAFQDVDLPEDKKYRIEILDIWEMTRWTVMEGVSGTTRVALPAKEGIALMITGE